jgi:hypothetical protein
VAARNMNSGSLAEPNPWFSETRQHSFPIPTFRFAARRLIWVNVRHPPTFKLQGSACACFGITLPEDETFDVGQDTRTRVALVEYRYDVPFKFTGKINKLP